MVMSNKSISNRKSAKVFSLKSKKGAVTMQKASMGTFLTSKKGFGGVASTLIMFIAIITVTTGLVVAFMNYTEQTKRSFDKQSDLASNKLRTSISISNIYYNDTSNDLYIYVKNLGETKLETAYFDLFIDEEFIDSFNVYYASDLTTSVRILNSQETLAIVKNKVLTSGTHSVRVITGFGIGDSDYFNT